MDISKTTIRAEELRQAWQIFANLAYLGAELCTARPASPQARYFTMSAPDDRSLKFIYMNGSERKRAQTGELPEQALSASLVDLPDYEFDAFGKTLGIAFKADTYPENTKSLRRLGGFNQVTFTDMQKAGTRPYMQCWRWVCAVSGNFDIPQMV